MNKILEDAKSLRKARPRAGAKVTPEASVPELSSARDDVGGAKGQADRMPGPSEAVDSGLTAFQFQGNAVRTVVLEGRLMFHAKDVCGVLGLVQTSQAIQPLDEDQKGVSIIDTLGGSQEVNVITESGVYALAFRSVRPEARKFGRWIVDEVLPAIRKTGRYEVPGLAPQAPAPAPGPALPWDLPQSSRFIVMRCAGRPDHIQETRLDDLLTAICAVDVRLLCHTIKILEGHWARYQHLANIEVDGIG